MEPAGCEKYSRVDPVEAFVSGGGSGSDVAAATGGGDGNGGGGMTVDVWLLPAGASEPTGAVARATAPAAILCLRRADLDAPLSLLFGMSEHAWAPSTRLGSVARSVSICVILGVEVAYVEFAAICDLLVRWGLELLWAIDQLF